MGVNWVLAALLLLGNTCSRFSEYDRYYSLTLSGIQNFLLQHSCLTCYLVFCNCRRLWKRCCAAGESSEPLQRRHLSAVKVPASIGQHQGEQEEKCETEASGNVTRGGGYTTGRTTWGNLNIPSFPFKSQEKDHQKQMGLTFLFLLR